MTFADDSSQEESKTTMQVIIDNMDNAAAWSALSADGTTPSSELQISDDPSRARYGPPAMSGLISATVNAAGHALRRPLPGLDLRAYDYLHLWLYGNRLAEGSANHPFYLELRLAGAGMGLDHPGNTWHRFLPLSQINKWEAVRTGIDDLPGAVRSAVNLLQIRCIDSALSFRCNLDQILAAKAELIRDVDTALLERLNNRFSVNGATVPATLYIAGTPLPASLPHIIIMHYQVRSSGHRETSASAKSDFSAEGYRLRPVGVAYDLTYCIQILAGERDSEARLLESILNALPPAGDLLINGEPIPFEAVAPPIQYGDTGFPLDRPLLHYTVGVRHDPGIYQVVRPVEEVTVAVDVKPR